MTTGHSAHMVHAGEDASNNPPGPEEHWEEALVVWLGRVFFARSCLGKVPGGAPFSQRSERATACTIRMQIDKQISVQDELIQIKQIKLQITNYKLERDAGRTGRRRRRR